MSKRRIAIYLRASVANVDKQLLELRHYCHERNWTVFYEYIDLLPDDLSDVKLPQLNQLLDDTKLGVFDLVLFYRLAAFGCQSIDYTIQILQRLKNCNIHWHSYEEPIFSTIGTHSDLTLEYMNIFSSVTSNKISQQTKIGIEVAKQRGIKCGRPGLPEEVEKQVIRYRQMGKSYNEISKLVTYKDPRGHTRHPSKGTISKILNENQNQFINRGFQKNG